MRVSPDHDAHCAPEAAEEGPPLRAVMLGGGPWDGAAADALAQFLTADLEALAIWFGQRDLAAEACGAPERFRASLRGRIDRDIAVIDAMIARQIDAILHHPRFSALEGSWRGLAWLVSDLRQDEAVIVRVLTVQWRELARDLLRSLEFDQSVFFKLVYEGEFGHPGGQPFGMMVIDREVAHQSPRASALDPAPVDDIEVLRQCAAVAAAAFVPMALSVSPRLLGVDQFPELSLTQHITDILGDHDHRRWRGLAALEDARFLCLTLPRLRARPAWTRRNNRLRHEEYAPDASAQCWHGACYALARNVLRAQQAYRWPADIRGLTTGRESGSYVSRPLSDPLRLGATTRIARAPTELGLTEPQALALAEAGLMALNTLPFGGIAFAATCSLQAGGAHMRHRAVEGNVAERNRQLSAEIVALLCVCRFAHHIKMLGRDMIGRITTASEIERALQDWLGRYTNASSLSSGESRARFPLLSSQVQVTTRPSRPGHYTCVIHLQPHYQLDDVSTTFRLVTNLSSAERTVAAAPTLSARHMAYG